MSVDDEPWFQQAVCRGMDADLFFPQRGEEVAQAKAVCRSCPVRLDFDQPVPDPDRWPTWVTQLRRLIAVTFPILLEQP